MNRFWSAFVLLGLLSSAGANAALSGKEIMVKNEEARKISDVNSSARLTTGQPGKPERLKEFTWWRKLTEDQVHFNSLTRFHRPAEIRGEGILFLERDKNENEILMYLPAFKKIRRVESQQQSGSFMGSEFSYSDITTPHAGDYQHKLVKEDACGAGESKVRCYVVESLPATESVSERTGYSKTVAWVRMDNFMVMRAEYSDLKGESWKKMEASQIEMVDPVKKTWMAHRVRIENLKTGRFTTLEFKDVKVNKGIGDSVFTQNNLQRAG